MTSKMLINFLLLYLIQFLINFYEILEKRFLITFIYFPKILTKFFLKILSNTSIIPVFIFWLTLYLVHVSSANILYINSVWISNTNIKYIYPVHIYSTNIKCIYPVHLCSKISSTNIQYIYPVKISSTSIENVHFALWINYQVYGRIPKRTWILFILII